MSPTVLYPRLLSAEPALVAGFTTRAFSPSPEPLSATRDRVGESVGMRVASAGQVHGADVAVVYEAGHVDAHDGLATDVPNLLLTVIAADCALVLLADPESGVVGACHSGWRGTVAGVLGNTVGAMAGLGAQPDRLLAYVGPCISTEAFEVGEEVAAQFDESVVVRRPDWPRPHVDLRAELVRQLEALGVGPARREVAASCTVVDPALYSYRESGRAAGRMVGYIGVRGSGGKGRGGPGTVERRPVSSDQLN